MSARSNARKRARFAWWLSASLLLGSLLGAQPGMAVETEFDDVSRIVAVADLHGDYEQYLKVLQDAGLVNSRGKWTGGDTHLVQTGDITDRGPDSIAIIDHLEGLKKQAAKKGGRVHTLIGNHEAMNSYGDLRYVHPGEFEHFVDRRSKELREKQWAFTLKQMQEQRPDEFAVLELAQYRLEWEKQIPLGWVEHRMAWMPGGQYGDWTLQNPVVVRVNDTLFLHGGLSAKYCHMGLGEMNERAHRELARYDSTADNMVNDEQGPLWYRGLILEDEQALRPVVDAILERYGARRIVVGHTPTGGVVWPRFDGRVVANDTGIAAHYGGNDGFLVIEGKMASAGYGDHRIELPSAADARADYLRQVISFRPGNAALQKKLESLVAGSGDAAEVDEAEEPAELPADGVSPGICR